MIYSKYKCEIANTQKLLNKFDRRMENTKFQERGKERKKKKTSVTTSQVLLNCRMNFCPNGECDANESDAIISSSLEHDRRDSTRVCQLDQLHVSIFKALTTVPFWPIAVPIFSIDRGSKAAEEM